MKISLKQQSGEKLRLKDRRTYLSIIATILRASGLAERWKEVPSRINFILTDDEGITPINETYLQHEGATDVITFDYQDEFEEGFYDEEDPFVPGEIIISVETADAYRREFSHTLSQELILYTAHGILHLCDYDDHEEDDIREMRAAEKRMMAAVEAKHGKPEII